MRSHDHPRRRRPVPVSAALVLLAATATPVAAHTLLSSPNGGEALSAGDTFTIQWSVAIEHDTQDWDLWYSTESEAGPWTVIAEDLPVRGLSAGSAYTHAWTVPDLADDTVWVRVRQDNSGADYFDISDAPFEISAACVADFDGNDVVGLADLTEMLNGWGACPTRPPCTPDLSGNGSVGFHDLTILLERWGSCP